ncbi:hypothetical protein H5410_000540 [Solanum commersonii]|uniref:Uncharacterized protein n=1 Tax=Solanum commersonii TaxID=4109 RepID=A0A9J6AXI8_SOLCO|nr:hypothetical protein H5410_000540 [Solanum commersonii]
MISWQAVLIGYGCGLVTVQLFAIYIMLLTQIQHGFQGCLMNWNTEFLRECKGTRKEIRFKSNKLLEMQIKAFTFIRQQNAQLAYHEKETYSQKWESLGP